MRRNSRNVNDLITVIEISDKNVKRIRRNPHLFGSNNKRNMETCEIHPTVVVHYSETKQAWWHHLTAVSNHIHMSLCTAMTTGQHAVNHSSLPTRFGAGGCDGWWAPSQRTNKEVSKSCNILEKVLYFSLCIFIFIDLRRYKFRRHKFFMYNNCCHVFYPQLWLRTNSATTRLTWFGPIRQGFG